MPLPRPRTDETEKDFIARFMSNERMQSEYPDKQQRLAVAYSTLRRKKTKDVQKFTIEEAKSVAEGLGIDFSLFTIEELLKGMNIELEHTDVTGGDAVATAKIALSHLKEMPDYYDRLEQMEKNARKREARDVRRVEDIYTINEDKTATIMRDGIYHYLAYEIGADDRSPMDIVKVFRPSEEVEKAHKAFESIGKLPVCADHPDDFLDLDDPLSYEHGEGREPKLIKQQDGTTVDVCKLELKGKALDYYLDGIREISCGWEGEYEKAENSNYDYIQRFTDFNHIALVKRGRCGITCSIKDGGISMDEDMKKHISEAVKSAIEEYAKKDREEDEKMIREIIAEELKGKTEDAGEDEEKENEPKADDEKKDSEVDAEEKVSDEDEDKPKEDEEEKDCEKKQMKDAVTEAVESTKKMVIDRFGEVLPAIEKGIITVKDCISKTPCEIKAMVVKKILDKEVGTENLDTLNAYYDAAMQSYKHPAWSVKVTDAKIESEDFASKIDKIGR